MLSSSKGFNILESSIVKVKEGHTNSSIKEIGGFLIEPSSEVPGRIDDVTGFFLQASNESGKVQWKEMSPGGGTVTAISTGDGLVSTPDTITGIGSISLDANLNNLTDVDTTGAVDTNILSYNQTEGKWKPLTKPSGEPGTVTEINIGPGLSSSNNPITGTGTINLNALMNDIQDVDTTDIALNRVLTFDGSNWVPMDPATGTPPGSDTNTIQFNSGSGVFNGSTDFTWDDITKKFTVKGNLSQNTIQQPSVISTKLDPTHLQNCASIDFWDDYAYITSDIYISVYKISNLSLMSYVSSVSFTNAKFLQIAGNLLYCISSNGKIGIFDISKPLNIELLGETTQDEPEYADATEFKIIGKYAFITSYSSKKFVVVDISDHTNIFIISSIDVHYVGSSVTGFDIQGNFAYVLNENGRLNILDISDVHNITKSNFNIASVSSPKNIKIKGEYAFITGGTVTKNIAVYNIKDPTVINLEYDLNTEQTLLDGAEGMTLLDNKLYVSCSTNGDLAIIDTTNISSLSVLSFISGLSGTIYNKIYNNTLFTLNKTNSSFSAIDLHGNVMSTLKTSNVKTTDLIVLNDSRILGNLSVGEGLNVGKSFKTSDITARSLYLTNKPTVFQQSSNVNPVTIDSEAGIIVTFQTDPLLGSNTVINSLIVNNVKVKTTSIVLCEVQNVSSSTINVPLMINKSINIDQDGRFIIYYNNATINNLSNCVIKFSFIVL